MPDSDTISFEYDYAAYLKANRLHYRQSPLRLKFIVLGVLLLLFAIVNLLIELYLSASLLTLLALGYLIYPYTLLPRSVRRVMAKDNSMRGLRLITFDYDAGCIREQSDFSTNCYRRLVKVVADKELLLLYTSPQEFVFIRSDEFATSDQIIRAREFVQSLVVSASNDNPLRGAAQAS